MKPEGKIHVVVRSRRVPVGTVLHTEPIYSTSGVLVGYKPNQVVLYGTSIDEEHRKTIEEAQKLATNLGLGLEVIDESRTGFLGRLRSWLIGTGPSHPSVLVTLSSATMAPDSSSPLPNAC